MRRLTLLVSAAALSIAAYGVALAADAMPGAVKMSGGMWTGADGKTLYTFDNDKEANKSACVNMCVWWNWPALRSR